MDTAPVLTVMGAARVTVEVLEVTLTAPLPPERAAPMETEEPVEVTVIVPFPALRAAPTVTAPVWLMVIAVPVVVIVAPVLSKLVPALEKPLGTVTVLLRSTAPPLVMVREFPLMVPVAVIPFPEEFRAISPLEVETAPARVNKPDEVTSRPDAPVELVVIAPSERAPSPPNHTPPGALVTVTFA